MHTIRLSVLAIAWLSLLLTFSLSAKTIVVVNSYHTGYSWSDDSYHGFLKYVDPQHQIIYHEMDTKRLPPSRYNQIADAVWTKIADSHADLVVTMDDNALKYLGQQVTDAAIPLVFLGVNNDPRIYFRNNKLPAKVSGVLERPLLQQNISYINKILAMKHKRILLMMDNGATSRGMFDKTLDGKDTYAVEGVDLELFITGEIKEWQDRLKSLTVNDYDAVLVGSFSILLEQLPADTSDHYILNQASKLSPLPLFTFWRHRIGPDRTIGGVVLSGYHQGRRAAQMANSILAGDAYPLVEISRTGEPVFSESQLDKWNIRLPGYLRKRSTLVE
jgi:hypothetical protein